MAYLKSLGSSVQVLSSASCQSWLCSTGAIGTQSVNLARNVRNAGEGFKILSRKACFNGDGGAGLGLDRVARFSVKCSETQTVAPIQATEEPKIVCGVCRGLGFFICDYCEGEKVNVPVKNRPNRFHRRCPTCRAVGVLMCSRCRVFKCVTFPDEDDGSL